MCRIPPEGFSTSTLAARCLDHQEGRQRAAEVVRPLALGVTFISAILAIALDHPVNWLMHHHWRRGLAIAVVMVGLLSALAGLAFIAVPPLVNQASSFVTHAPEFLKHVQGTAAYQRLDARFDLHDQLSRVQEHFPALFGQIANRTLRILGSFLALVGGVIAIFFILGIILIFRVPDVRAGDPV